MTVGRTCPPTRESRHEVHPATTTIIERPRPRVGAGNGRGQDSEGAYKKVANEGKMVRFLTLKLR